jgi:hypothetical protein
VWEVKEIQDIELADGVIRYEVNWKGFSVEENTWEPYTNLSGCKELLKKFHVDHPDGIPAADDLFSDDEIEEDVAMEDEATVEGGSAVGNGQENQNADIEGGSNDADPEAEDVEYATEEAIEKEAMETDARDGHVNGTEIETYQELAVEQVAENGEPDDISDEILQQAIAVFDT